MNEFLLLYMLLRNLASAMAFMLAPLIYMVFCSHNLYLSSRINNLYVILQGHEGRFSVYVHASKDKPLHFSRYFINREIRSDKVCEP